MSLYDSYWIIGIFRIQISFKFQQEVAIGLVFSVLFQETFRYLIYLLLDKADTYLKKLTETEETQIFANKHILAYVVGLVRLKTEKYFLKFKPRRLTGVWTDERSLLSSQRSGRQPGARDPGLQWRTSQLLHRVLRDDSLHDPAEHGLGGHLLLQS